MKRVPQTILPKRFYDAVSLQEGPDGFAILLDGRCVRTPARTELRVENKPLAEELVREWEAQGDQIEPDSMPMTKRVYTALDRVRGREEEVVKELAGYAGADLLCYRAEAPEGLVELQCQHWDPVLAWVKASFSAAFKVQTGVTHLAQSETSLEGIGSVLAGYDAYILTALHGITTMTGSVFLALAYEQGHLDTERLWSAAHVDEDWQISRWGEDSEAGKRRMQRRAEFDADSAFLALSRK